VLHIISQSPSQDLFEHFDVICANDVILLINEGLYCSLRFQDFPLNSGVYAIEEDRIARGLNTGKGIEYIDYPTMVELTENHHPIHSWRV